MLRAPFPWFGGKSRVASIVWDRFGDVANYIEPFFGSGAVLLARPHYRGQTETVNDADGFVANAWRAIKLKPDETADFADWPVNENDLHARHAWLVEQRKELTARLEGDPEYCDPKIAGWWIWGVSSWIGSGFCSGEGSWVRSADGKLVKDGGGGVKRQIVFLSTGGMGVHRKLIRLDGIGGVGVNVGAPIHEWFASLSERLRNVRVACGDWTRICGPCPTRVGSCSVGIFLDPPYSHDEREEKIYSIEMPMASAVRDYALEMGRDKSVRVALCGYEGEHEMPDDWECFAWKTQGGYAGQSKHETRAKENVSRERIWFSPGCKKSQLGLFERREERQEDGNDREDED